MTQAIINRAGGDHDHGPGGERPVVVGDAIAIRPIMNLACHSTIASTTAFRRRVCDRRPEAS